MIKHHPKFELLQSFVNGELPASLAAGIAIHADMCPVCQKNISQLTEQVAEISFEQEFLDKFIVDDASDVQELVDFDKMIEGITTSDEIDTLQLRKHEKDFLARKDLKYVDKFKKTILLLQHDILKVL